MNINIGKAVGFFAVALIFVLSAVWLSSLIDNKVNPPQKTPQETINEIQETLSPYQAKDTMEKLLIIEDFSNSSSNGEPTDAFTKELEVQGIITGGFLFVRASVNDKALTQYADIYVKIMQPNKEETELGGHLVASFSLETPKSKQFTELLFKLSDIKYKKSFDDSTNNVLVGNWLAALNELEEKHVLGFTSTTQNGIIEEISIFYECLENTDCSITTK